jgi:hypothetical protein
VSSYLTRVELHGATYDDYEHLHKAMKAKGFTLTIRSGDGTLYRLPPAEYDISTTASGEQVRAGAQQAAESTGRNHAVVVVRYDCAWWSGLQATTAA